MDNWRPVALVVLLLTLLCSSVECGRRMGYLTDQQAAELLVEILEAVAEGIADADVDIDVGD